MLPNFGKANMKFFFPSQNSDDYLNLTFYYGNEWNQVYPNPSMDCNSKQAIGQTFSLAYKFQNYDCQVDRNMTQFMSCNKDFEFFMHAPQWWFMVLSRCSSSNQTANKGIRTKFTLIFTNGETIFTEQFSADQMGIFETTIGLFVIYTIIIGVSIYFAYRLIKKDFFHSTFKLFMVAVFFQFMSFLFLLVEYSQYSQNGRDNKSLRTVGRICDYVAQTLFFLMLILIGKGYTVTRSYLRGITLAKIIVLFTAYVIAYVVAFIYSEVLFDPAIVNYFYGSPVGIALILIKLIFGWIWFCYAVFFTLKHYPEKKRFYVIFVSFYSLWFWASPFFIILANYAIGLENREKYSFIGLAVIAVIGYTFFLGLICPFSANHIFPYHSSTNFVDAIDYPHHDEKTGGNQLFALDDNVNVKTLIDGRQLTDIFTVEGRDPPRDLILSNYGDIKTF